MSRTLGTTAWLDLNSTDLDTAKAFYAGLFGWTFEDGGEALNHYAMVRNGDALVGGAMDVSGMTCPDGDPLPSAWSVYLAVDDVDARVSAAREQGAQTVVEPDDAGRAGRFAVIVDSNNAGIGLWQAGEIDGYDFTGQPGSPVWFENMTHGFERATEFYTIVFGANLVPMLTPMAGDDFHYATNGPEDEATWGLCDATDVVPADATGWRIYFAVDSTDAALARVRELGGEVLDGPVDSPFGRIATVADPTGATFQITALGEAEPEA